jgi:hypothetical protein
MKIFNLNDPFYKVIFLSVFFVSSISAGDITDYHKEAFGKVEYNKYGIASIATEKGWFAIDRKKNILLQIFIYDNGPDYISEGLFRFVENGKMGFANPKGKVVIPAAYDFVWPFENGKAQVCNGCEFKKVDEHTALVPNVGTFFYINKKGKVIKIKD